MLKPLSLSHPELADEWHPTKNGDLTPDKVVARSARKIWWWCAKGPDHEWQATLSNRSNNGSGCPCCEGLKVSVTNSLATLFPLVAADWHPTKNGNLTPDKIVAKSHSKVWWLCPKAADHEWQATVNNRTNGRGCPHCVGKKVSVTNSLAILFPGIATEWHPTKNGGLTPDKVVTGSQKKFWWRCAQGTDHEWQASLASRTHKTSATGCPFCRGLQVSITNSLAALFPDIAAEWHSTKNGTLTPDQVVAGSGIKVWWKCMEAPDHEWQASLVKRTH